MREILLEEYPDLIVSVSSEVWPEYREYERTVTTLVDAFVKPHVAGYLGRAEERLREVAPGAPLLIMKSNGGVMPAAAVARRPISTALSGPAAGALGASWLAQQAGFIVEAELLPVDKARWIKEQQDAGRKVAMVGDGFLRCLSRKLRNHGSYQRCQRDAGSRVAPADADYLADRSMGRTLAGNIRIGGYDCIRGFGDVRWCP